MPCPVPLRYEISVPSRRVFINVAPAHWVDCFKPALGHMPKSMEQGFGRYVFPFAMVTRRDDKLCTGAHPAVARMIRTPSQTVEVRGTLFLKGVQCSTPIPLQTLWTCKLLHESWMRTPQFVARALDRLQSSSNSEHLDPSMSALLDALLTESGRPSDHGIQAGMMGEHEFDTLLADVLDSQAGFAQQNSSAEEVDCEWNAKTVFCKPRHLDWLLAPSPLSTGLTLHSVEQQYCTSSVLWESIIQNMMPCFRKAAPSF